MALTYNWENGSDGTILVTRRKKNWPKLTLFQLDIVARMCSVIWRESNNRIVKCCNFRLFSKSTCLAAIIPKLHGECIFF